MGSRKHDTSSLLTLTIAAVGVVYGDIGTSVLYALKEVFGSGHVPFSHENVYGILSLMFWTLTVIVSFKYVGLILRADNHGEGGLIAMLALASHSVRDRPRLRRVLMIIGIFGASLFYGDGVITPAISVLSAIEGLEVLSSNLHPFVLPLTVVVLFVLFAVQRKGTAGIGRWFGPITVVWFITIAILGIVHIIDQPRILAALSPTYAATFVFSQPGVTFVILGAIILTVTGAEALYADLGHFGKQPIRIAWFLLVMPCLTLNYFGQGALLLVDPSAIRNPFYLLAPEWMTLPLVLLATMATVIASQALITGAFSVTRQAIQLGFLPRLRIEHTNTAEAGQIYIPFVNWSLFVAILLAIGMFRTSGNLAAAYGIAVSADMLITTTLTFFVIRYGWKYPLALCIAATGIFFMIDLAFLASNMRKLFDGGWFPLAIGAIVFTLMVTWKDGRRILTGKLVARSFPLREFLDTLFVEPPARVDGTAIYLSLDPDTVPNALLHNLKHNKVLHEVNLFVTVKMHEVPWIGANDRIDFEPLGRRCWLVTVHYGFKNDPDLPRALTHIANRGFDLDPMTTSYFLSRDTVVPTPGDGMADWREKLFATMHRNAGSIVDHLNLPSNAVVEMGGKIEI